MPRAVTKEFFAGGLNTRPSTTGLPVMDATVLQDMRVVGRDLIQRKGIAKVTQAGGAQSYFLGNQFSMTFTAASSMSLSNTVDSRVWSLGLYWTIEFLFDATSTSGTQGLVCAGHTTPSVLFDITGGNIRARVWDTANAATSLTVGAASTDVTSVQLTRSGATLSAKMDNGTAATTTMSASLLLRTPAGDLRIARDDGSNYFGGTFDYLRVYTGFARADHNDRLVRNPAPRASYCVADYDFKKSAADLVYDRSRYENHLICNNTPVEASSLCWNPAPVRALAMSANAATGRKEILLSTGKLVFVASAD